MMGTYLDHGLLDLDHVFDNQNELADVVKCTSVEVSYLMIFRRLRNYDNSGLLIWKKGLQDVMV